MGVTGGVLTMTDDGSGETDLHGFFSRDHARLDKLFNHCLNSRFQNCLSEVEEFARGLIQHIIWEDEYIFPVFEQVTGMDDKGPTFVMRSDHHTIQEMLYELVLGARDGAVDLALSSALQGLLLQHNQAEENVIYDSVQSMLVEESRAELLEHMENAPPIDLDNWIDGVVEVEESEASADGGSPISRHGCD